MRSRFAVLGLGHFGFNLSLALTKKGAEVLAVDNRESQVERLRDRVAHAVVADAKDKGALASLGLEDMDAVIVAIGEDFESSILATANLQEIGVKKISSRVVSPTHEKLLKLMNVEDLILPEAEAAEQFAHKLIRKGILEYLEISKDHSIVELHVPKIFVKKTLGDLNLRKNYGINLITIIKSVKKAGLFSLKKEPEENKVIGVLDGPYVFEPDDILVVFGSESSIKKILDLSK